MEQVRNFSVNSLIGHTPFDPMALSESHSIQVPRWGSAFDVREIIDSTLNIFLDFNRVTWDKFDTRDLNLIRNVSLKRDSSIEIRIIRNIKGHKLSQALILTVSYEDNLVFVEEEILNIWGEGDTYKEALENFEDFFLYDFESYKNMPNKKMDVYARKVLKLYRALLKKSK